MIGGNVTAELQTGFYQKNLIGEMATQWVTVQTIKGFIDYMGDNMSISDKKAKIEDSSHVFICDYVPVAVDAENARMVINGGLYDIRHIDNPMNLNKHLEIYLKYLGGQ